ncbi:hypothetical protein GCM10009838_37430 [Catenulispora subtropica]|uniref:Uncharacterized protein n=1 Tax=Catenulispora subtropica TaxID=450798 RepID=A0ABN2RSE4_9ACTN
MNVRTESEFAMTALWQTDPPPGNDAFSRGRAEFLGEGFGVGVAGWPVKTELTAVGARVNRPDAAEL